MKYLNNRTRLHQPFDIGDVEKVLLLEDRVQCDCGVFGLKIVDERFVFVGGGFEFVTVSSGFLDEEVGQILRSANGSHGMGASSPLPLKRILLGVELHTCGRSRSGSKEDK